jgi:hypothetical protein
MSTEVVYFNIHWMTVKMRKCCGKDDFCHCIPDVE